MSTSLAPFPSRVIDRLNQVMEELATSEPFPKSWMSNWAPPVDISETDTEYRLKMDLPGFEPKDIDVQIKNGVLTISGKREQVVDETKEGTLIRYERRYGDFRRSFALDAPVKPSNVTAKFEKGVLVVTAPKMEIAEATKVPIRG